MIATIRKCDNCKYECLMLNDDINKIRNCKWCGGLFRIIEDELELRNWKKDKMKNATLLSSQ